MSDLSRVCAALAKLPCARDNCIGVGALSRHRRWRGLGAFVCDGIARETVEGRGAVSGSLAGMFPARLQIVGKSWQFFDEAGRARNARVHDMLTGTQPDGRAYSDGADHTCRNW